MPPSRYVSLSHSSTCSALLPPSFLLVSPSCMDAYYPSLSQMYPLLLLHLPLRRLPSSCAFLPYLAPTPLAFLPLQLFTGSTTSISFHLAVFELSFSLRSIPPIIFHLSSSTCLPLPSTCSVSFPFSALIAFLLRSSSQLYLSSSHLLTQLGPHSCFFGSLFLSAKRYILGRASVFVQTQI